MRILEWQERSMRKSAATKEGGRTPTTYVRRRDLNIEQTVRACMFNVRKYLGSVESSY